MGPNVCSQRTIAWDVTSAHSLVDVLQQYDAVQHVVDATCGDNTLDLMVMTSDDTAILPQVAAHPTCFSDHRLVTSRLHVPRDMPSIKS